MAIDFLGNIIQPQQVAPTDPVQAALEALNLATEQRQQATQQEPLGKRGIAGLILAGLGDAVSRAAAQRFGGAPAPSAVQQLVQRREAKRQERVTQAERDVLRAEQRLERAQEQAQRQQERREEREFRAEQAEQERGLQRESFAQRARQAQLDRDFQAEQNRIQRNFRLRLEELSQTAQGARLANEFRKEQTQLLRDAKVGIQATKAQLEEKLQTMTPDEIRDEFSENLDVLGLDPVLQEEAENFWIRSVEPRLRQAETAVQARQEQIERSRAAGGLLGQVVPGPAGVPIPLDVLRGLFQSTQQLAQPISPFGRGGGSR